MAHAKGQYAEPSGHPTWTPKSWGRTRRPKNVNHGKDGVSVVHVASLVAAKAITDAITGDHKVSASQGVYQTENQRYLHLCSSDNGTVVNIWVFHYATGKWSELVTSAGASITLAAKTTKIVEIAGVDLVAFNTTNPTDVFASCSTF